MTVFDELVLHNGCSMDNNQKKKMNIETLIKSLIADTRVTQAYTTRISESRWCACMRKCVRRRWLTCPARS